MAAPFRRPANSNNDPAIPKTIEATRTPSRTCVGMLSSSKASVLMNRLIVKPMLVGIAIPWSLAVVLGAAARSPAPTVAITFMLRRGPKVSARLRRLSMGRAGAGTVARFA